MASTTASLNDISWSDMTAAGIDIDLVRENIEYGEYVGVSADGRVKIAFGVATPEIDQTGGDDFDMGWNVTLYDVDEYGEWSDSVTDWHETPAEVLALAGRVLAHDVDAAR